MSNVRTSSRAILRRGDTYLVVRYRDAQGDWFVFPGGGQQHGEDLHEALAREVREEIGARIVIGPLRFVRESIAARHPSGNLPRQFHQVEIFFDCTLEDEPLQAGSEPDPTQTGVEWLTIVELQAQRFFPQAILANLAGAGGKYLGVC